MKYLEFWERFLRAEQKAQVFDIKTIGYQLYPMLRTRLYYQLAQELGIFDNPHPNPEPKEQGDFQVPDLPIVPKTKTVVIPFVRKIAGHDPYSYPIQEALDPKPLVLEISNPEAVVDIERIKIYGRAKYEDVVYQLMLKEKVRDVRDRWSKMAEVFEQELGVGLGKFAQFPNWLVRRYIAECMGFKEFFESLETKKLYLVNAYSNPSVVVGAKQAGVKVIEIQHGFISEYHPAYSYPNQRIQCAPNKILVWGSYWSKAAPFPRGMKAIATGPSSQFLEQRSGIQESKRTKNTILFTSQGALGAALLQEAIKFATLLPEMQVTFRLHPNEDLASYSAKLPKNLTLSHKSPGFLELLSTNEYLVGGFSTTLYEGLSFGLKVIVLPLSGFENLKLPLAAGDMVLAEKTGSRQDLLELLSSAKICHNPYSYYAKQTNLKRALRA